MSTPLVFKECSDCCAAGYLIGYSKVGWEYSTPDVDTAKRWIEEALSAIPKKIGVVYTTVYSRNAHFPCIMREVEGVIWDICNNFHRAYEELGWLRQPAVRGSYGNYVMTPYVLIRNPVPEAVQVTLERELEKF